MGELENTWKRENLGGAGTGKSLFHKTSTDNRHETHRPKRSSIEEPFHFVARQEGSDRMPEFRHEPEAVAPGVSM